MKIFESIHNFIQPKKTVPSSGNDNPKKGSSDRDLRQDHGSNSEGPEPGLDFLDGMSTGTARFIIDREVGPDMLDKYDIKDLENKGRYYLAKIVNQDGDVTETVLIDKLNRSIHFQKAKFK